MADQLKVEREVLAILTKHGPLYRAEIYGRSTEADNADQISAALHVLAKQGHVIKGERQPARGSQWWIAATSDSAEPKTTEPEAIPTPDTLMAQLDAAFDVIRAAVAKTLEQPEPVKIGGKDVTLEAIDLAMHVLRPGYPDAANTLGDLRKIIQTFDDAA